VTNGQSCTYDGLQGVCVNGVCGENLCEDVVCDEPCRDGVCDYLDGACDYTSNWQDGTPCTYDGIEGVCVGGVCGEDPCEGVDCDDGDACTEGTCVYPDATCEFTQVLCDDEELCTEDVCDPAEGCVFAPVADGTPCGSGLCEAGECAPPCDPGSSDVYECPVPTLPDEICCPGYEYCRNTCAEYEQDFESLDRTRADALAQDGWLVFGVVVNADGDFKFNYGPFTAPNDGMAFSEIVAGEGGLDQQAQQLSVFSDYNCCDPTQGHRNGTDQVISLVYQQPFGANRPIATDDVGKALEFSFDAKRGDMNDPTGSSTALAFLQTVDPSADFAQTRFVSVDMTSLPADLWDRYSISLTIDEELVGQYLAFGFQSTASNFEPSGVLYDNILAELEAQP
jgi:hypothetical protein